MVALPASPAKLGPRVAQGATAEVFSYGDGRVVKLLHAGRPRDNAEREAAIGRLIQEAGIPAPAVAGMVEIDGRYGVVFERVDGPSMLDVLMAQPWRVARLAPMLGELHARVHRAPIPAASLDGLRRLPIQLERKIGQLTHLTDTDRAAARSQLAALERDYAERAVCLCHGDFHPGNVMLTPRGPIIVDWNDATAGPPAADVARTETLLLRAKIPDFIRGTQRLAIRTLRRLLFALYLRKYRALTGMARAEIDAWRRVTITARLAEGVGRK